MPEPVTLPGGYDVEVVGESYYQDNLDKVCGGRTRDGHYIDCQAELRADRRNPYDANAVAVYVDGRHVGHLSRETAKTFKPVMDRLGYRSAVCAASIRGGWERGDDVGNYGVRLDLASVGICVQVVSAEVPQRAPERRKGILGRILGSFVS